MGWACRQEKQKRAGHEEAGGRGAGSTGGAVAGKEECEGYEAGEKE